LLLRCLPQLRAGFPEVAIVPESMPTAAQLTGLRSGTVGLGIGWATLDATDVRTTVLSTERFVALVPMAHPLARQTELSASELSTTCLPPGPTRSTAGCAIACWPPSTSAVSALRELLVKAS
jgi:DNA-binding transcriptional LysR family regulator